MLLAACVTREEPQSIDLVSEYTRQYHASALTMVYECGDDYGFVARIQRDTAWVFLPGETVALLQVSGESDTKYEQDDIALLIEGEDAWLEQGENAARECVNNRRSAIWEHAKLNGADFRAVGNEPGWHLEIHHDRIVLVADYGAATYEFDTPNPATDPTIAQTTYQTSNDSQSLTVVLHGGGCIDTMSGEEFEVAVAVTLDDITYRGCGRPLH